MLDLGTDKILAEVRGAVGWMTINNPARRNAISLDMWEAIAASFDAFARNSAVRCVVMQGAGDKAFASGADISQFEQNRANAEAAERYGEISLATRQAMLGIDKPVIAMIRGFCMGGGLGIALTADIRITAEDGVFGIPAGRLGIAYDTLNLTNAVNLIGPSKAKEILFTAKRYSAAEALAMGLVNEVVPVDALASAVEEICARIAENAPLSIRASKLTIDELSKGRRDLDHDLIRSLIIDCFDSEDYQEGRTAFMEKRKPVFQGC